MPDLLLVSLDDKSCFEIEAAARKKNFRVKSTTESSVAQSWLKTHSFDVVCVDSKLPIDKQQLLAGRLWQSRPLALFIAFDLEGGPGRFNAEVRLFGAELLRGPQAISQLEELLEKWQRAEKARVPIKTEEFKVMVVEDLDSPRDIICMFIESMGYPQVSGWRSAREAQKELLSHPKDYSCVVTDIRMPDISGKDLIDFIRSRPELAHLPVVVLTAYGTVDTLIDCLKAGATGFLIKPPKKKDLAWELARALRIIANQSNPRLASPEEAETMRDALVDKGFM